MSSINLTELDPTKFGGINSIINAVTSVLFPLGGVLLFFMLIWAGFDMFFSHGNAEKIKSAKQKITYSIIGFVVLISSFAIIKIIAYIAGLGGESF